MAPVDVDGKTEIFYHAMCQPRGDDATPRVNGFSTGRCGSLVNEAKIPAKRQAVAERCSHIQIGK